MDKYQTALKERADNGDKSAEEILINSYVQNILKPVMPMLAMRVKLIMEEVFDLTRKKYEPTIRTDNSAVIANLQAENERLRKALLYIAYEHVLAPPEMAKNHFRQIAREALAISKIETTTMGDEK